MSKISFYRTVFVAALLVASSCYATDSKQADMTAAEFTAQKALFVQQLDDGKTYSEITPENRKQVVSTLDRMDARVQKFGSVNQMTDAERVAFFNDQEAVNTLLTNAKEDSRVVCKRETPVGSHMMVTKCRSVAQIRKDREDAQKVLQGPINSQAGGGG